MTDLTRRSVLAGAAGVAGLFTLAACGGSGSAASGAPVGPGSAAVRAAESARRRPGSRVVTATLAPRPHLLDLGDGVSVATWSYGEQLPGPLLRARAGDTLRVSVRNGLPDPTTVHWHGVAIRNDMDGVPDVTQRPIAPGGGFDYDFVVPDPGTYFYHPHVGVQLDRGLYGVLVVEDPAEKGDYDAEWVVVLDDWVDGTGRSPDDVLAALTGGVAGGGGHDMGGMGGGGGGHGMGGGDGMGGGSGSGGGMGGMAGGAMGGDAGGTGDVTYPYYLINGRVATAPASFTGRPGQRVRLRIVNAAADTAFRIAIGDHRMRLTHTDGWPAEPVTGDALYLAMGERADVEITLGSGVFPLTAIADGKDGSALAVVRTGSGTAPTPLTRPAELDRQLLRCAQARPASGVRLPEREPDRTLDVLLSGGMGSYVWTINGARYPDTAPLPVRQGERVRLRMRNHSMMAHPMHLHGHTFAVVGPGARKDTVVVPAMGGGVDVDLDTDNPGQWMLHCHNVYHAEAGMMTVLSYRG